MNEIMIAPAPDAIDRAVAVIQTGHEKAAEIPAQIIRAGAVLAVQVGANPNPLAGELYIYPIMGRWTPYLGIAYYRRIAEERGARVMFSPGRNASDEPRAMTPEERETYNVPEGTDAAICKGFRGDRLYEMIERGIPWIDAVQMIARTGIAFLRDEEKRDRNGKYMNAPSGRSWQWKCNKRAEMDLYRKLGVVANGLIQAEQQAVAVAQALPVPEDYGRQELNEDLF